MTKARDLADLISSGSIDATEFEYLDGVTSDIQTQLDSKAATSDIGTTIQAYDADTAKYDDTTANFTGTLQNGGSNVVVDSDIGVTVLAPDGDGSGLTGVDALPSQTDNSGKYLTTDGSTASWATVPDEVIVQATEPTDKTQGTLWYNTTTDVLYAADGTNYQKVAAEFAILTSVSGGLYPNNATTLTLSGTGFLADELDVLFSWSGTDATVTVTATSDTSATVAVPSSIYNAASVGDTVNISVTNVDGSTSGSVSKSFTDPPFTATISPAIGGVSNWDFSSPSTVATASGGSAASSQTEYTLTNTSGITRTFYFAVAGAKGGDDGSGGGAGGYATGGISLADGASVKFMAASRGNDYAGSGAAAVYNSSDATDPYLVGGGGGGRGSVSGGYGGGSAGSAGSDYSGNALGGGGGTQSAGGAGGYGDRGSGSSGTFRDGGAGYYDSTTYNYGRGWGNGGYGGLKAGDGIQGGGGGGYYGGGGGGASSDGAGGGGGSGFLKSGVTSGSYYGNANNSAGYVSVKGVSF